MEHWRLGIGRTVSGALQRIRHDPFVVYAEPNYRLQAGAVPNDPRLDEQWALINTGQIGGKVDADIDADLAWDVTTGSSAVIVAVLDTAMEFLHPDLQANLIPGYDSVDDDPDPSPNDLKPGEPCLASLPGLVMQF